MARVTGGTVADRNAAFVGEIPGNYDRYLGPIFFHGYADDLAARLPVTPGMRVLETACGTGIVTRRLADRISGHGWLVATDLNEAMLAHGRANLPAGAGLWNGSRRTPPSSRSRTAPSMPCSASSG